MKNTIKFIAACAVSISAAGTFAHVTLQDQAAAAGVDYRGVLRVGHGCEGAATTSLKLTVPAGFNAAQPMVKPGWTVSTKVGALAEPYDMHGKKFTEGVLHITWTVNNLADALPDSLYDEFVFHGTTPKKPGTLWFKVVQVCTQGSNNWVEVPEAGKDAHSLKFPAAKLEVLDIQSGGGHSH